MTEAQPTPEPTLELRTMDYLLDQSFWIPSYQRGYRWSPRQVTELLDDLLNFWLAEQRAQKLDRAGGPRVAAPRPRFYCLQPVVVLLRDRDASGRCSWELIDGQQRLTTLWLLLKFLVSQHVEVRGIYHLTCETREPAYLRSQDPARRWDDPDSHHLHAADEAIATWFRQHPNAAHSIARLLLDPASDDFNTRVIWYELPVPTGADGPTESAVRRAAIDAFVRLNAGKIRLTNAELIRALFLRADNFEPGIARSEQLKLAQEWDHIEQKLQDETFWYFAHGSRATSSTRIDYIFRAYLVQEDLPPSDDEFGSFLEFQKLLRPSSGQAGLGATSRWRDVRQLAQRLEEWEQDRVLYHLVGYVIAVTVLEAGDPAAALVSLLRRRKASNHRDFEEGIKAEIFSKLFRRPLPVTQGPTAAELHGALTQLRYKGDRVRPLLLLFNVATLVLNPTSPTRFPFDLFATQSWDVEHIRPVEDSRPEAPAHRRRWLDDMIEYWTGRPAGEAGAAPEDPATAALCRRVAALREEEPIPKERFDELYNDVMGFCEEDLEVDNTLGNLTLLDSNTNRSYKNAPFRVKRRRILEHDRTATFVPLCTTNVFLKYYSRKLDQMLVWSPTCREDYVMEIANTLASFFAPGGHRPKVDDE